MKNLKSLLMAVLLLSTATVFAQTNVSGKVVDEINQPLPGATVVIQGSKIGVSTDFDGNFNFDSKIPSGTLIVSFIGYESKKISFNGGNVGTISLKPSAETLEEIVITQTSFAIDRKTPVAVSTIKASVIENKLGSQEFPEILKSTPGVYATKEGGGFGDGRLNLRGFNSENVAVMINGVPVNDMENGSVYWSNWAGLSDVTGAMQVQRGLGASKVAVPSVGGTVNIITKNTDVEKGGNFYVGIGNDNYSKVSATLSTGLLENGWAASVSGAASKGDGYIDGTPFQGYSYFFNLSKQINAKHKIALTTFGAPQTHGKRYHRSTIEGYKNAETGARYNPDWGILNGSVFNVSENYYHKNQTSLNWYWDISEKSDLSTVVYASWGRGGGEQTAGEDEALFDNRLGDYSQPIDLDYVQSVNMDRGQQGLGSAAYILAAKNEHDWYGIVSTFKTDFTDAISLVTGIDLRTYTGYHYQEVTNLLGGSYVYDDSDVNDPNRALQVGGKLGYNNDGKVDWAGFFAQAEYDKDDLSLFAALSLSNTSYKRIDHFQYLDDDPLQTSDRYNFFGYSVKGGANYNITTNHNVFANIGYFTKAPSFKSVFPVYNNEDINADAKDQAIFSMEVGYGYRSEKLAGNVNIYRTQWKNKSLYVSRPGENIDDPNLYLNIPGVNALHQGIEIDGTYKPFPYLTVTGMLSLGDWTWDSNVENAQYFDEENQPVGEPVNLNIKGIKVGNSAQTTAALGVDYEFMPKTHITFDYNYFGNLYSDFEPNDRQYEGEYDPNAKLVQPWEVPDYGTFDASLRYSFMVGTFDTLLTANMYNIFNTSYIADSDDGSSNNAETAFVFYGFGRTFNISAKFSF